jgi:predicted GTPase
MISRRSVILAFLIILPVLAYMILGGYALWTSGLFRWLWWVGPALWGLSWIVAWIWRPRRETAEPADIRGPAHWTDRDEAAAAIVRRFQARADSLTPNQLADPQTYRTHALELARELALHYHPHAADEWSALRLTEVLAAARLAIDDLEPWVVNSLPGSHLLTIERGRLLQKVPKWWGRFQNVWLVVSSLWDPTNLARGLVIRLAGDSIAGSLKTELIGTFYSRFMQCLGHYLIEMNSGRLRGGADAYRRAVPSELRATPLASAVANPVTPPALEAPAAPLTIALVGQVSAGKSSLVNALFGSYMAAVDLLPETTQVARYQLTLGGSALEVTLLDTPGYGATGATADQASQIRAALQQTDAVLLVMDAHSPAREADRQTIAELAEWYAANPQLKSPPLLGVLTHVDLLRPTLEWTPPYDWRTPRTAKAQSLHDAVQYVRELFATALADVIPVCTHADPKRVWGVLEEVIPAVTMLLSEAQSVALLRAFEHDLDYNRFKLLLTQVRRFSHGVVKSWIEQRM